MSKDKMTALIEELKGLEAMEEELKREIESLKTELKTELETRDVEELTCGQYIIRWTSVLSSRFDTKRFKEHFGEELYKAYTKEVASKRFTIAQ